MRVTIQMPCAVVPGASEIGVLWPRESVAEMARMMNNGEAGPTGMRPDDLFGGMGLKVRVVPGTAKVDASRENLTGYLYVIFEAEVPSELELSKMAIHGISLIERDGLDLDMTRRRR